MIQALTFILATFAFGPDGHAKAQFLAKGAM